ncbi:MAG: endolytic transglycosylase MltG [Candidatus Pacebacteria bacterium]|nr:endolytic transglycosylase MltG [Candidatus Paceibacterota bacterium]
MSWRSVTIRASYSLALVSAISITVGIGVILESKSIIFSNSGSHYETQAIQPFPVSVNVHTEVINDSSSADSFFYDTLAGNTESHNNWWNQVASVFASKAWYQNLASPVSRIIVIWPGERKEEVVKNIGDVLRWSRADKEKFIALTDAAEPQLAEGKYFPGQYVAHRSATPEDIHTLINEKFSNEVLKRYTPEVAAQVPLQDALIVASLLEREASDFNNMREVSGVIWNRLFIDMPLQLDATLQYVKGSRSYEPRWWPAVRTQDKFAQSPYNTYKNAGLPPAPIANPSAESILAALNPIVTECFYYFHTDNGDYLCSETYEDHVQKLRSLYGRGS